MQLNHAVSALDVEKKQLSIAKKPDKGRFFLLGRGLIEGLPWLARGRGGEPIQAQKFARRGAFKTSYVQATQAGKMRLAKVTSIGTGLASWRATRSLSRPKKGGRAAKATALIMTRSRAVYRNALNTVKSTTGRSTRHQARPHHAFPSERDGRASICDPRVAHGMAPTTKFETNI